MIEYNKDFSRRIQMQNNPYEQGTNQNKTNLKQGGRWPGITYWIILLATVTLLIALTASLFIGLAVGSISNGLGDHEDEGPSGGGQGSVVNNNTNNSHKSKTGISLPSATPSGNYLSASTPGAVAIDGIISEAAILVNLNTNTSTAEKNSDSIIYPASMTKVMTLLVACENLTDPSKKLTVTEAMVQYQSEMGGSGNLGFVAGESITVEDALYLINYRSDTIACLLIAEHIAKSEAGFVQMMNTKAQQLGLTKTNFTNCTGLHNDNHYTTCREMAAIMKCAIANPTAKKIITAYSGYTVNVYGGETDREPVIYSGWYSERMKDNAWVGGGADVKVLGGKTGYEDIPTSCFVTYAKNTETNVEYICVTVGRVNASGAKVNNATSTADTKTIYKTYAK